MTRRVRAAVSTHGVAGTIAFLLSDAAAAITGTESRVDQGRTLQGT